MADMFVTTAALATLVGTVDTAKATTVIEAATAVVQAATGQDLLFLADDAAELEGDIAADFHLPQRPVTAVASVALDGEELAEDTDYTRSGAKLYRECGWQPCHPRPSKVAVVYSHGYADDDQRLQLAKSAVLMLAAAAYQNPGGAVESEKVGDYSVAYAVAEAKLEASPYLKTALRRKYGRSVGTIRQGV
jgi:hypothetical protein